jgi:hypothetical protein
VDHKVRKYSASCQIWFFDKLFLKGGIALCNGTPPSEIVQARYGSLAIGTLTAAL